MIDNAKHHKREINGYKSQLKQHNEKIVVLKHELEKAKNSFDSLNFYDLKFKPITPAHPSYREIWLENIKIGSNNNALKLSINSLKDKNKKLEEKNEQIILSLAKIQKELEKSYTAIGAVMAYANGDDYFIKKEDNVL